MSWKCTFSDNDSEFIVNGSTDTGTGMDTSFGETVPMRGDPGASAYEVAVENGFKGSEEEWLASLVGPQGGQGPAGYTPVRGKDYWTESDKQEIAEEAAALVPNVEVDNHTIIRENGVLRVNTADDVGDYTLPITAAAVNVTVGNIEELLKTI